VKARATLVLFAIAGSLRARSSNRTLLEAASAVAPDDVRIDLYDGVARLPHFNPDLDANAIADVVDLTRRVRESDGVIVSSPEYARGIPGALKNALDWLVGGDGFVAKPFMLLNASDRSQFAQRALIDVLQTMSGIAIGDAFLTVPLLGQAPALDTLLRDARHTDPIRASLATFVAAIRARRPAG
jgi:chromate reductase, NAD(P)H dehydrogenase (quinone)